MKFSDRTYTIDGQVFAPLLYEHIPGWLKNSEIDPPEPEASEVAFKGMNKGALIAFRSAIKGFVAPFIPAMYQALYGVKLPLFDRSDKMPIIAKMIVVFLTRQLITHPMEFVLDEDTSSIIGIRPYVKPAGSIRPTITGDREFQDQPGENSRTEATGLS